MFIKLSKVEFSYEADLTAKRAKILSHQGFVKTQSSQSLVLI